METNDCEEKLKNVAEFLTKVVYKAREHKGKIKVCTKYLLSLNDKGCCLAIADHCVPT